MNVQDQGTGRAMFSLKTLENICSRPHSWFLAIPWLEAANSGLHMAFSTCSCFSLCPNSSFYEGTSHIVLGLTLFQYDLILTNYICNDPFFQIRSHSDLILGVRTYYGFGGGDKIQPITKYMRICEIVSEKKGCEQYIDGENFF